MNYLNHTTWWPPRTWSRSNSAPQLAKLQSIQAKVKHITYLTSDIVVDSVCEQWLAQKKREFLRDWTTTSDNCAKANQIPIPTHVTDTWWKWEFFFHKQSPFELSSHSFQVIMFHTQPIHSKFLESNPPWITGKKKKHPWLQPNSRKPSDVCEVRNLGVIRCFIISNGMTSATFHLKRHVERNVCFCKNKCPPCMASAYSFELLATLAVACCQRELDGTSYTLLRCRILKNTKKTMCQTFWAWTRSSEVVDKEFF